MNKTTFEVNRYNDSWIYTCDGKKSDKNEFCDRLNEIQKKNNILRILLLILCIVAGIVSFAIYYLYLADSWISDKLGEVLLSIVVFSVLPILLFNKSVISARVVFGVGIIGIIGAYILPIFKNSGIVQTVLLSVFILLEFSALFSVAYLRKRAPSVYKIKVSYSGAYKINDEFVGIENAVKLFKSIKDKYEIIEADGKGKRCGMAYIKREDIVSSSTIIKGFRFKSISVIFLPDTALIKEQGKWRLCPYAHIAVTCQASNRNKKSPPSDTKVVSTVWQHSRTDGGRDRRYSLKNNSSSSICEYGNIKLSFMGAVAEIEGSDYEAVRVLSESLNSLLELFDNHD